MFLRKQPKLKTDKQALQQAVTIFLARMGARKFGKDGAALHEVCLEVLKSLFQAVANGEAEFVFGCIFPQTQDDDVARAVAILNNPYLLEMFLKLLNELEAKNKTLHLKITQALLRKNTQRKHFWDIVAREASAQTLYHILYKINGLRREYIYLNYFTEPTCRAFSARQADLLEHMQRLLLHIQHMRYQSIMNCHVILSSGGSISSCVEYIQYSIFEGYISVIRERYKVLDASLRPNFMMKTVSMLDQTPEDMSLTDLPWSVPAVEMDLSVEIMKQINTLLNATNAREALDDAVISSSRQKILAIFKAIEALASAPAKQQDVMDLLTIQIGCADAACISGWSLAMAAARLVCGEYFLRLLQQHEIRWGNKKNMALLTKESEDGHSFWHYMQLSRFGIERLYDLLSEFGYLCPDSVLVDLAPRANEMFEQILALPTILEQINLLTRIVEGLDHYHHPLAKLFHAADSGVLPPAIAAAAAAASVTTSSSTSSHSLMKKAEHALQELKDMQAGRLSAEAQIALISRRTSLEGYRWYAEDGMHELREQVERALNALSADNQLTASQKAKILLQPTSSGWHFGMAVACALPIKREPEGHYSQPLLHFMQCLEQWRTAGADILFIAEALNNLNARQRNFWHCISATPHRFVVFYTLLTQYSHFITPQAVDIFKRDGQVSRGVFFHILDLSDKQEKEAVLRRIADRSNNPLAMFCAEYAAQAKFELDCRVLTHERLSTISMHICSIDAPDNRQQLTTLLAELSANLTFENVHAEIQRFKDNRLCHLGIAAIWLTDSNVAIGMKSDNALMYFMDILMALLLERGSLADIQHFALDAPQKEGKSFWDWLSEKMSAPTICQFVVKYRQLISDQSYQALKNKASEKVFDYIKALPENKKIDMLKAIITRDTTNYLADFCSGFAAEAQRLLDVHEYKQGVTVATPKLSAHAPLRFNQPSSSYGGLNDCSRSELQRVKYGL